MWEAARGDAEMLAVEGDGRGGKFGETEGNGWDREMDAIEIV